MARGFRGKIAVDIRDSTPDWTPYLAPKAPAGAPNVLMIVWDDVGYGTMDCYGGPVQTPVMTRIANLGVRYSNFHTTALCSPTRASLLTGRNATSNGMATIAEFGSGFPGISCRIPFENGFLSEVLVERGYNTYCIGKWHLTPGDETNVAAYKGRWPLGRGFERFYGFLGGESSCWYPDLVSDNHPVDAPAKPEQGYHIAKDFSDKAIQFIRDAKVVQPDKPFFLYLALDAAHAPHHVFREWADRYRGTFDEGYEAIRPGILRRQKEIGLLPENTRLSPINPHGEPAVTGPDGQPWPLLDTVRPWDSLSDGERRLFVRMAEVFAGYVSYTDDQVGRVIDFLEASGELDNTIIVVVSDNGGSGEGGPDGTFNEWRFFNNLPSPAELSLRHIDELGTPKSYNHYNTGWAWAFDTPFPYWKRWAGYEGGVADMCMVAWPARLDARGEARGQYVHAVDVVPTLYELLDIEPPETIKGHPQSPIEGESFAASLTDPSAPGKQSQFYAMLGQRSLYHDGWLANSVHPPLSGWRNYERDVWELYHLPSDRAQAENLAEREPERLGLLQKLWFYYAGRYHGLPLDDRTPLEQSLVERPHGTPPRNRYVYYPDCPAVPEQAGVLVSGRSYTISAGVKIAEPEAEGVLYAHGGVAGGHSLYVKDRRLRYVFNWVGSVLQAVDSDREITPGPHVFAAEFTATGRSEDPEMPGATGTLTLYIDDQPVGDAKITTQPGYFNATGDGICVGRDDGSPVTPDYPVPFRFTGGTIDRVVVDVSGERYVEHEAEVRGWFIID
ncbi:sulfatase-like hydrolase/transferase [Amycolatopsis rhizosphaerae]|uniref:Sulfatase-like hydrolase/transferase n=1 Tax=Amycolatopsis rhizosphaerae TaxID=2053003 RepID=A0A558C8Q0_9PSEU|nr:arylsulfatase [Amycolatopsis rhizosphaerae]TVT45156.1 sulfatase-like hydrolase/transferase [Amycolatopsis rhizosphaerae]